jgi:hypothetical protein
MNAPGVSLAVALLLIGAGSGALPSRAVAAGDEAPAGRVIFACGPRVDLAVFESATLTQADDLPRPAVVFDQELQPQGYKTCYRETWGHRHLKIVRPYDGAAFPPNIAPSRISWEDQTDNTWMVCVRAKGWSSSLQVVTREKEWRPSADIWKAIKQDAGDGWVDVEVRGCSVLDGKRLGEGVYVDRIKFRISRYPADPCVVFRMVTPLFHGLKTPDICYQEIGSLHAKMFLPGKNQYCTNCHSFPANPSLPAKDVNLAIAVREQLVPGKNRRMLGLYDFATRAGKTMNVNSYFMCWSPDGSKVAVTGGHEVLVRPMVTLETQQFYVLLADIVIVDTRTLEAAPLPGASEPEYMESFPTWSPDGKTIVFARARELSFYEFSERKYDLYQVSYNDGAGGKATPVPGASQNGMSNFAPRYSPDGKWIVFNQAEWGSLVAPSAHLWILSTEEGAVPRKLECNCDAAMDSHHSWSSNSRWLLFASKRDDGIFARLYLSEIDEAGHAAPPVELPTEDDTMMSYNVPESLRFQPEIDADDILAKTTYRKD